MTISRLVFAAIVLLPFLNGPVSSQTAPQSGSDTNSKPFTFERFKDELSKAKDKKHRLQLIDVANVQGSTNVDAMMLIANFFWKSGEESDYEKAIEYLQKAESLGSVEAALRLAQIYSSGKQVSPNEQLALFHYETAANAGDNTARIKVADAYLRGSIVVGDTAKAVDLLDKASSSGSGLAALRLGDFYRAGSKGELARSYYEHAASLGMNDALVKLGDVYREGLLVPEGAAKAFELYEKALELKVPLAYSRVGDSLVRGNGVKPDVPRGLSLLGVAAENGNYSAARLLGDFFSNSDYTKRDVSKAIDFYQIAGRSGDGLAYLRLGELYRDGKFVSKDNKKALFYISKAVELGDKRAEVILGQSHIQGKFGSLSSKQKGVKLISNARMKGELTAAPTIAYLYAAGAFGRKDNQKALSILTAEVKRGSAPAVLALVSLYRDGKRGVEPRRLGRRPFGLSYAAIAGASSMA